MGKRPTLGSFIRERRAELGLTQVEFAEAMGTTQATVNRWENDVHQPTPDRLRKLAKVLDVPVGDLMPMMTRLRELARAMGVSVGDLLGE